jgi:hypothetical protein
MHRINAVTRQLDGLWSRIIDATLVNSKEELANALARPRRRPKKGLRSVLYGSALL